MRLAFHKFFIVFFVNLFGSVFSQNVEPRPATVYPIYDKVGLLNSEEKNRLNDKLIKYSDSTSTEIVVIILPNTGGEDVNFLAAQYGEKWGIGKKDVNNGVVFLISIDDRRMSIQQGRAIEQYITASMAGQILDLLVSPSFKKGLWYEGIDKGTSAIIDALQGKFHVGKEDAQKSNPGFTVLILGIIIALVIIIMDRSGKGGRKNDDDIVLSRRGKNIPPVIFFPGGFRSGGGSSRSGGFGGFGGGGSFGGGGASGSW